MADSGDSALRQVLDTLQMDESVKKDRQYLESVLRRLGYSERQIREELGPVEGDEELEEEPTGSKERLVEVEYLDGLSEAKTFERVYRANSEELTQNDTTFEVSGGEDEEDEPESVEFSLLEESADEDLMDFKEAPPEEPEEEDLMDFSTVEDDWEDWPDDDADTDDSEAPYTHGDFTLHGREVTDRGGNKRMFYFFAKNEPKSGEPCAMPEGYQVHVSERNGLPYLKRDE